jgi:hypothetical protein
MTRTQQNDSARAVKNACLTGYGYSLLADFMFAEDVAENRLVQLLPNYEPVEQPIYAFYAQRRHTPQKIRVFVDYLAEIFGSEHWNTARIVLVPTVVQGPRVRASPPQGFVRPKFNERIVRF